MKSGIVFDDAGFERQAQSDGPLVWLTPKGDALELSHYAVPPDIEADLDSLRALYRRSVQNAGLGIIEIEPCVVDSCKAVRTVFKAAQEPTGRAYLGALTFPFRDFSYVFRLQCQELGTTGVRDSIVLAKLMSTGEVKITTSTCKLTGWLDDPYDPEEAGAMTRNKSERPEYDEQFPDHPLSRARRVLDHLQRTIRIDETIKRAPAFSWHE